jgi:hypothetical protein
MFGHPIGFRVGLRNPVKSFRIEKRISEDSKTLKDFPIVTSSETEKIFQTNESIFKIRKPFLVSEFVTIGNSLRVSEGSETIFSIRKPSKEFFRTN